MPKPDGTRTRNELYGMIVSRTVVYMLDEGMTLDEAVDRASADVKLLIETEHATMTAQLMRDLGIKPQ